MREIKFRAWDGVKMYDPMPIINFKIMEINGIKLMQYTGLKDKHGTDIYEGDIISFPDSFWDSENGKSHKVTYKSEVKWEDGAFVISSAQKNNMLLIGRNDVCEIISNIYEEFLNEINRVAEYYEPFILKKWVFYYEDGSYTFEIEAYDHEGAFNKAYKQYGPQVNDMFCKLKEA